MRRICERQRRLQLIRARIEEEGVTGWRIERERALRLAYVVAAHGLFAELENEFRTIVDFERLALRLSRERKDEVSTRLNGDTNVGLNSI